MNRFPCFLSKCGQLFLVALFPFVTARAATRAYCPGQSVPDSVVRCMGEDKFFSNSPLPDSIFALMQGRSYKKGCPVKRSALRYIRCLHRDKKGCSRVGEMVVNRVIAAKVLAIFRKLYHENYPIERMLLVDRYGGDDEQSMRHNNSSAFNYRPVSHTATVSRHGLGMAVDINPLYNPYNRILRSGKMIVEPANGRPYLDRSTVFPYKIVRGDVCHRLFLLYGFTWGGTWRSCKDYQHFEYR